MGKEQTEQLLDKDIRKSKESLIKQVKVMLTDNQLSALSFFYKGFKNECN